MTGWREPVPDVDHVAGVHPMPCPDPSTTRAPRRRKGNPKCSECVLGETGVCGRHGYSILRSVAGAWRPGDVEGMRGHWRPA